MACNKVKREEFMTMVKGGAALDMHVVQPKAGKWIIDSTWLNLVELSNLHQFSGILEQVSRREIREREGGNGRREGGNGRRERG